MNTPWFELYRYDLPLSRPLNVKGKVLTRRTGLIVGLEVDGRKGYGDIAPLPGISREDLQTAINEAMHLGKANKRQLNSVRMERLQQNIRTQPVFLGWTPSVRFGFDTAICSIYGQMTSGCMLPDLGKDAPNFVLLSGLLTGSLEEVAEKARRLRENGYRSAKLKVGARTLEEDIQAVRAAREALGPDIPLRLDANRAWDYDTALQFGKAVAALNIDYIEEPFPNVWRFQEFAGSSGLPVALDEAVREMTPRDVESVSWAKVLILKPTLLGGRDRLYSFVKAADRQKLKCVVSSTFESGYGLLVLAHLAADIGGEDVPSGLDTFDWLQSDLLTEPIIVRQGRLYLEDVLRCLATLDTSRLELIGHAECTLPN
ncbi:MAG: o-succinylbenzoate synthase [Candidatus Hydrogenedentes bacterium]|nr:o-succinylbenzoate synthase [Candidatus Hydrogenedentota bacterium]